MVISDARGERFARLDWLVLAALAGILIAAAATRRDFLGDGLRHLPAALGAGPHLGEPRWLLFPALLFVLLRPLASLGLVTGIEGAITIVLWLSVAAGIVFLVSLRVWLRAECQSGPRRAAALLLAGGCAPFLMLFSDVAEPSVAAALVVSGLAFARLRRDDPGRAATGAIVAIVAIACASLIYQGMILAFGMLPLVASRATLFARRIVLALGAALVLVPAVMIAAQAAAGTPVGLAAATTVAGEQNPLARSMMARRATAKYVAALVAGPPHGIVVLKDFSGLPALASLFRLQGGQTRVLGVVNALRLLLGCAILAMLGVAAVRHREWRVVLAMAVLLVLPVLRNQQYAYPKFFILWPVPVALLALRCPPRSVGLAALLVLASNADVLGRSLLDGRRQYTAVHAAYRLATPGTCWMTSGWAPPLAYLWPGTTTPMLGTLATGTEPALQAAALTRSLRRCFCDSASVWTDTSERDAGVVTFLARHFDYRAVDLTSVLPASSALPPTTSLRGVRVYPEPDRQRVCSTVRAAIGR